MKWFKRILVTLAILFTLLTVMYFFFPGVIVSLSQSIDRSHAHLTEKSLRIDDHRIVYLEGGQGDTIVLLHGFGAEKDNWTKFAAFLTPRYHVVIPDLPGFGESTKNNNSKYDIASQASRVKKFIDALGIRKIHIAGNSMGGAIAGSFSLQYGNMVTTLGLFNSGGVKSPNKSEYIKMMEQGKNPLLVENADDFDRMLGMLFVRAPKIPSPVKRHLASQSIRNRPFNEKIMNDYKKNPFTLEPRLGELSMPVLILWGDRDRLLDVSSASVFAAGIRNNTTAIMKECGHIPMVERPDEAAGIYLKFLHANKGR
ncbi:MAG TPA: alpha/beta hydrolase [Spirochaetota bacterium]|nr:alpha/beta hydrolase [Spirochaetota bacterium]